MAFETPNQPFSASSLAMIDRVLAKAGYRGTPAEVDSAATSQAAQFLIQRFLEGATSEEGLTDALARRGRESIPGDQTPMQVKEQAIDRWDDEGGGTG